MILKPAPPDAAADAAWETIMQLAREHALVAEGYGGAVTLATPRAQREAGLRAKCLKMSGFDPASDAP